MNENYIYRIRRVIQSTLFVLALAFLGWGFTSLKTWFAGLILGITISLLNSMYTAWKVHKVGEMALSHQGKKKMASLGTLTRYSMAILATVIALQFPQIFSVGGMIVGLIIPLLVAYGDAVFIHMKENHRG